MNERRKKVLATAWHPGSANSIASVIKRLRQEDRVSVTVIGHQYSEPIFLSNDIEYRTINDYDLTDVSFDSMNHVLEEELPDLVLTGTSDQNDRNKDIIEQCFIKAAKFKLGIKSLTIMDWWSRFRIRFSDIFIKDSGLCFLPDKIAVLDEIAKENALNDGIPPTVITVTGNPYFDVLPKKAEQFTMERKIAIRQEIGLGHETLFFYAGNIFKSEAKDWGYWDLDNIRLILDILKHGHEQGALSIVVKLHPRMPDEDKDEIRQFLNRSSAVKLITDIDTHDLILASDLTFVAFSTVGIEAVNMSRPCISLQPGLGDSRKDVLIPSKKGIIPAGYTPKDCLILVRQAVYGEYRSFLLGNASVFRTDGKATERVTNLVYDMLGLI